MMDSKANLKYDLYICFYFVFKMLILLLLKNKKEYEPIYKARQTLTGNEEEDGVKRRRRRSGPDDDNDEDRNTNSGQQSYGETKRFYGLEEQQQNGANANMNAGYSSTLL